MRHVNIFPAPHPQNLILSSLSVGEYERLAPHLEPVRLNSGRVLYNAGDTIRHAFFLRSGMASLVSVTENGRAIEVGMIGNEGMVGVPVVLRVGAAPYQVTVQLPGNALRIKAGVLKAEFDRGGKLQDLLLRYTHTVVTQIAQSAACNRFHTVEERLCRWLLVSRDRAQTDTLHLTQEFLAQMIGVPRTSVTMIAGELRRAGLIAHSRGKVQLLDLRRLRASSCECYRVVSKEISHFAA
ncbi:MAG: Crp/Fnr family transcriptional regulator [Pyrinomonadaceae bacterium]